MLNRFLPDYKLSEDVVVIIALGHVALFSLGETPPIPDQLFLALGIKSQVRRKKLLKHLEGFDYADPGSFDMLQEDIRRRNRYYFSLSSQF